MRTRGFIDLVIRGIGLCNDEISTRLDMTPNRFNKKGDTHKDKYTNKTTIYSEDSWYAGIEIKQGESPEDALTRFVDILHPHSDYIKSLSTSFDVILWLSLYPDDEQMNVHLSPSMISRICDMCISIDVSAMFLKQIYERDTD